MQAYVVLFEKCFALFNFETTAYSSFMTHFFYDKGAILLHLQKLLIL